MKNLNLKAIVVVALALVLFGATSAFADSIDVAASGGTYQFTGAIGSVFTTTDLGSNSITMHLTSPFVGPDTPNLGGTISFTSGLYLGGGNFAGGGTVSYYNSTYCGVVACLLGNTSSSTLIGSTALVNFTTNYVNPLFAALVGANFADTNPNSAGTLSLVLSGTNSDGFGTIASADYSLVTPEPASLLMLGGGLLAVGGSIRRKLNLI